MVNIIWVALILTSILYSFFTGEIDTINNGILTHASSGFSLILEMMPLIVLWTGIMKIAENSGLLHVFAKALNPILRSLFTILKIILGIIMVLIAFGYKNIKYTFYNIIYLYMVSIILGGFVYYLNVEFNKINDLILLLLAPFILYIFMKSLKVVKEIKNYYYKIKIVFNNQQELNITAFLDTGNKLVDPITNKPIILLNKKKLKDNIKIRSPMYVPYNALNYHGLLECIKPEYIVINNKRLSNYLIGLSEQTFKLNGIDCLLNYKILEEIC